jgi:hypothetical protein
LTGLFVAPELLTEMAIEGEVLVDVISRVGSIDEHGQGQNDRSGCDDEDRVKGKCVLCRSWARVDCEISAHR